MSVYDEQIAGMIDCLQLATEMQECMMCCEEKQNRVLPCTQDHQLCRDCIFKTWKLVSKEEFSCPYCRVDVSVAIVSSAAEPGNIQKPMAIDNDLQAEDSNGDNSQNDGEAAVATVESVAMQRITQEPMEIGNDLRVEDINDDTPQKDAGAAVAFVETVADQGVNQKPMDIGMDEKPQKDSKAGKTKNCQPVVFALDPPFTCTKQIKCVDMRATVSRKRERSFMRRHHMQGRSEPRLPNSCSDTEENIAES